MLVGIGLSGSANSEMMMTMELLVYPSLALMVLLMIYALDLLRPGTQFTRYINHNLDINVDKCASEDCARCNKYKAIIKKASTRYSKEPALQTEAKSCGGRLHQALVSLEKERKYETTDSQQPNILMVDGLEAKSVWLEDEFVSDVTILESETSEILKEFEHVYNNVWPEGWLVNNTPTGEWAVYHLINQGAAVKKNVEACPKTYGILQKLVTAMGKNIFANASFSVVQSGTEIRAHYGPTNVRIRCHLGLKVSDPQSSYMTVGGNRANWEVGKCLIFDDSFLHCVHHTDIDSEPRAVLLIDLWHPDLTEQERNIIDNLFKFQKPDMPTVRTIPIVIPSELGL